MEGPGPESGRGPPARPWRTPVSGPAFVLSVLDALPEIVHLYDAAWRWVHINPAGAAWLRSVGRDPDKLIGRCIWDEFPATQGSAAHEAARRAVAERREVLFESRVGDREYETRIVPHVAGALSLTRDMTEQRREARRRAFEAEAGGVFSDAITPEETLRRLADVAARTFADYAVAYLCEGDRMRRVAVAHADPAGLAILRELEHLVPLTRGTPLLADALAARRPLLLFPLALERFAAGPEHLRLLRELGPRSAALVRVVADGAPIGVLSVATTNAGKPRLTDTDADVFGEVARRAGLVLAVERSRRMAVATARRTGRLLEGSAALSRALPREEVLDVIIAQAVEATGAYMGAVLGLTSDGHELVMLRHLTHARDVALASGRWPVDEATPAGEVARTREAVFLQGPGEWRRRYGSPARRDGLVVDDGAWAALPLIAEGQFLGELVLAFEVARTFEPDDRGFLETLAHQCARALERGRLHDSVRAVAQRLRAVVDTAVDAILTIDERGTIESLNPATERMFGYTRDELLGRNVRVLMPEPYHSEHDGYLERFVRTGEAHIIGIGREVLGRRKDGSIFPIDLGVSDASTLGRRLFTGILRDATERRRAEAALREAKTRLELILAAVRDGVTVQSPDGALIYANDRAAEMLGYASADALLRAPGAELLDRYEILDEEGRPFAVEQLPGRRALHGEAAPEALICWRERATAECRWSFVRAGAVPSEDGSPLFVVSVIHELTERMRQQRALEEARAELEAMNAQLQRTVEELRLRTEEAESARAAAEAANIAKAEFLGVVSHELRTPLNSVMGYTELLLMETRGALSPGQREQAERIKSSASHQLGLIEEILTYMRIDAGREELRIVPVDVGRVLRDVAEFVRPEAVRRGLALEVSIPAGPAIEMLTDPGKLRQVVLNLAGNAVKFTDAGQVVLAVSADGGSVRLQVRDTGAGIAAEQREAIWEPFTQGDSSRTRAVGGTGLGLAIVRRLVELMGGTVDLVSELGRGSTFTVRLPRRRPG